MREKIKFKMRGFHTVSFLSVVSSTDDSLNDQLLISFLYACIIFLYMRIDVLNGDGT